MLHLSSDDASSVAALLSVLARERRVFVCAITDPESSEADREAAGEMVKMIDGLDISLKAGDLIDLAAGRSAHSAAWDEGEATTGGYLLCLIRDEFNDDDWQRLAALGVVAVKISPSP